MTPTQPRHEVFSGRLDMTTVRRYYILMGELRAATRRSRSSWPPGESDQALWTPSCRFTSERRGFSSHPAFNSFVQHLLCLRFVSRLSPATDSDKLTKAHEAKKRQVRPFAA